GEALAEGLVLDRVPPEADAQAETTAAEKVDLRVPPEADAQAETTAAEKVDLGRLLGDQGGLALGEDDDAGHQLDRGDRGQIAEEHQRLVKGGADVVGTGPAPVDGGVGAEDVVVGEQVG